MARLLSAVRRERADGTPQTVVTMELNRLEALHLIDGIPVPVELPACHGCAWGLNMSQLVLTTEGSR